MELDPESRRILALARAERTPDEEDKARVKGRLALSLAATASAAATAGSASTASAAPPASAAATASSAMGLAAKVAGTATGLKWTIGGCALIGVALVGYAALPESHSAPTSVPAAIVLSAPPAEVAPAVAPAAAVEPAADEPEAEGPKAAEQSAEAQDLTRPAHARARRGAGAKGDELSLLHAAQSAWRAGDPARALALVGEHRARHPRSAFAVEREALRVLTLCDLGRTEEASRLGRAWLARSDKSPLRASIERSCVVK
jgi:hypothetical protein